VTAPAAADPQAAQQQQQQFLTPQQAQMAALIAGLDASRAQAEQTIARLITLAVSGFGGWYQTDRITTWTAQLAHDVELVLKTFAGMTDAYMASMIGNVAGRHVRPVGTIDVTGLRTGVTHPGAFGRAADQYRWQQSRHDQAAKQIATAPNPTVPNLVNPLDAAMQRALDAGNRDTGLVLQQQAGKNLADAGDKGLITGWRRVVHPELSRSGTCGLCIAASTRIYKTGDLMPLHDNCHCEPVPIVLGKADPGLELDELAFHRLYSTSGGNTAAALKKTRWTVHQNGEIGPVLAPEGAKQRTPRQVQHDTAAPVKPIPITRKEREMGDLLAALQRSMQRIDSELVAADPEQWTPYRDQIATRIADLQQQLAA
jgi:hypothetical protein